MTRLTIPSRVKWEVLIVNNNCTDRTDEIVKSFEDSCRSAGYSRLDRQVPRARGERADLALFLDVIYHLVEDRVFEDYMRTLVAAAHRYMIIYASNSDDNREYQGPHIKHRKFSTWLQRNALDGELLEHVPNRYSYRGDYTEGSFAEFFIYGRAKAK